MSRGLQAVALNASRLGRHDHLSRWPPSGPRASSGRTAPSMTPRRVAAAPVRGGLQPRPPAQNTAWPHALRIHLPPDDRDRTLLAQSVTPYARTEHSAIDHSLEPRARLHHCVERWGMSGSHAGLRHTGVVVGELSERLAGRYESHAPCHRGGVVDPASFAVFFGEEEALVSGDLLGEVAVRNDALDAFGGGDVVEVVPVAREAVAFQAFLD